MQETQVPVREPTAEEHAIATNMAVLLTGSDALLVIDSVNHRAFFERLNESMPSTASVKEIDIRVRQTLARSTAQVPTPPCEFWGTMLGKPSESSVGFFHVAAAAPDRPMRLFAVEPLSALRLAITRTLVYSYREKPWATDLSLDGIPPGVLCAAVIVGADVRWLARLMGATCTVIDMARHCERHRADPPWIAHLVVRHRYLHAFAERIEATPASLAEAFRDDERVDNLLDTVHLDEFIGSTGSSSNSDDDDDAATLGNISIESNVGSFIRARPEAEFNWVKMADASGGALEVRLDGGSTAKTRFGSRQFTAACFCMIAHAHRRFGKVLGGCAACGLYVSKSFSIGNRWADSREAFRVFRTRLFCAERETVATEGCVGCTFIETLYRAVLTIVRENLEGVDYTDQTPLPFGELVDANGEVDITVCRGMMYEALLFFQRIDRAVEMQTCPQWYFDDVRIIRVDEEKIDGGYSRVWLSRRMPTAMIDMACETTTMIIQRIVDPSGQKRVHLDAARRFIEVPTDALETLRRAMHLSVGSHRRVTLADQWGKDRGAIATRACAWVERPLRFRVERGNLVIDGTRMSAEHSATVHERRVNGFETYGPTDDNTGLTILTGRDVVAMKDAIIGKKGADRRLVDKLASGRGPVALVEQRHSYTSFQYPLILDNIHRHARSGDDYYALKWIAKRLGCSETSKSPPPGHLATLPGVLLALDRLMRREITATQECGPSIAALYIGTLRDAWFRVDRESSSTSTATANNRRRTRVQDHFQRSAERSEASRSRAVLRGMLADATSTRRKAPRVESTWITGGGYTPNVVSALWAYCRIASTRKFFVPFELARTICAHVAGRIDSADGCAMVLSRVILDSSLEPVRRNAPDRPYTAHAPCDYSLVARRMAMWYGPSIEYIQLHKLDIRSYSTMERAAAWYRLLSHPDVSPELAARAFLATYSGDGSQFDIRQTPLRSVLHDMSLVRMQSLSTLFQSFATVPDPSVEHGASTPPESLVVLSRFLATLECASEFGPVASTDIATDAISTQFRLGERVGHCGTTFDVPRTDLTVPLVESLMAPLAVAHFVAAYDRPIASVICNTRPDYIDWRSVGGVPDRIGRAPVGVAARPPGIVHFERVFGAQVTFIDETLPRWKSFYNDDRLDPSECGHVALGGQVAELMPFTGSHPQLLPLVTSEPIEAIRVCGIGEVSPCRSDDANSVDSGECTKERQASPSQPNLRTSVGERLLQNKARRARIETALAYMRHNSNEIPYPLWNWTMTGEKTISTVDAMIL